MTIKQTCSKIKGDLIDSQFTFNSFFKNYLISPRFRVLLNYRIGKYFSEKKNFFLRQIGNYYKARMVVKRNCDISYNSNIGVNLQLPHPMGIVIGDGVEIKDNVTIFQQVTLGSHGKIDTNKCYPIINSGVKIFAGAKIIGGVTVGENAVIGANALVNIDVPRNSIAIGIPCRILKKN